MAAPAWAELDTMTLLQTQQRQRSFELEAQLTQAQARVVHLRTGLQASVKARDAGRWGNADSGSHEQLKERARHALHERDSVRMELRRTRGACAALDAVTRAEMVAIAFLLDATASMAPHLEAVTAKIQSVVDTVTRAHPTCKLHVAFVAYRDHDDPIQFERCPFTDNISIFKEQLSKVQAKGGGDSPEDVHSALVAVLDLDWPPTTSTRLLIHIADAPCHGSNYHELLDDQHPQGLSHGLQVKCLLETLCALGAEYIFGRLSHATDKMVEAFNKEFEGAVVVQRDMTSPEELRMAVTAIIVGTMSRTASALINSSMAAALAQESAGAQQQAGTKQRSRADLLRDKQIAPRLGRLAAISEMFNEPAEGLGNVVMLSAEPVKDWFALPAQCMTVLTSTAVDGLTLEQLSSWGNTGAAVPGRGCGGLRGAIRLREVHAQDGSGLHGGKAVRLARLPFAKGEVRYAYYGRVEHSGGPGGGGSGMGDMCEVVVKRFQQPGERNGCSEQERYVRHMEETAIAGFLAELYNAQVAKPHNLRQVHFNSVYVVRLVKLDGEAAGAESDVEYAHLEKQLANERFFKYCNNTGHWDHDHFDPSLARFSLFTLERTGGYMMVTDLQGVLTSDSQRVPDMGREYYTLTDPVILCKDVSCFSDTNLGEVFMQRCKTAAHAMLDDLVPQCDP